MLESLARRRRARNLIDRGLAFGPVRGTVEGREAAARRAAEAARSAVESSSARRALLDLVGRRHAVPAPAGPAISGALAGRLSASEQERLLGGLDATTRAEFEAAGEGDRAAALLQLALHARDEAAIDAIGMRPHDPPEDVHAMDRGPMAAAGAPRVADMVAETFATAGVALGDGARVLDFGCSSGRVLRPLIAARPDVEWYGCDPNAAAVAWADRELDGTFFVSQDDPPLALDDAVLDAAFAISIWSHFSPPAAVRWLDEMHRVIRPGGHLLATTHGWHALNVFLGADPGLSEEHVLSAQRSMAEGGTWFFDPFGDGGDWGVESPDWGHTFLLPEWVLSTVTPAWSVELYVEGGLLGNQDVFVLRRN
ncbi:class I SAM-dependent methyltransferase [Patulibacter americanus]|uniref:class I SAM-dependent methyltransferase n=1 Tax=Patulibacter americanus TaxID=588672 RepID=UPI0003B3883D|nr:class I SAM-dependent methyltransferase [Patulibacter americanus]